MIGMVALIFDDKILVENILCEIFIPRLDSCLIQPTCPRFPLNVKEWTFTVLAAQDSNELCYNEIICIGKQSIPVSLRGVYVYRFDLFQIHTAMFCML